MKLKIRRVIIAAVVVVVVAAAFLLAFLYSVSTATTQLLKRTARPFKISPHFLFF